MGSCPDKDGKQAVTCCTDEINDERHLLGPENSIADPIQIVVPSVEFENQHFNQPQNV